MMFETSKHVPKIQKCGVFFKILMPKYFARAKGDKNISSPPKFTFNYCVIPVVGYWARWSDPKAAMDICKNANFTGGNGGKKAKLVFIILQTKSEKSSVIRAKMTVPLW